MALTYQKLNSRFASALCVGHYPYNTYSLRHRILSIVYSILKVATQQGDKHTIIIERQGYKNGKTFVDKCIGIAVVLSNRL